MTAVLSGKRVLVVEDEVLIATVLTDYVAEFGCHVVDPAHSANQALELIASCEIDLAILDINLGKGGTSAPVADALAERGIPYIFATGYGEDMLRAVDRTRPRIDKPYREPSIRAALESALNDK